MDKNSKLRVGVSFTISRELRDKIKDLDGCEYAYILGQGYEYVTGIKKLEINEKMDERQRTLDFLINFSQNQRDINRRLIGDIDKIKIKIGGV